MKTCSVLFVLLATLGLPSTLHAQSLADVARQEAARRKTVTQPSKVYTNADVKPDTLSRPQSLISTPTAQRQDSTAPIDDNADDSHGANFCKDCERDAKGRIQRSEAAKREFQRHTGFPNGRPGWIVDHIVALACGGSDDPSNMQWQTKAESDAKDKTERVDCRSDQIAPVAPATNVILWPVQQQPIIVIPLGPTCGVNTPREQAMANAISGAGFGTAGSGQPCDDPTPQPTPGGK